jgi:hypothetical protein
MKNLLFYLTISIIIVFSFFLYSSNFFAALNSDDAITILMLQYFKLPGDLYFWGQDRYGSLIPLAGQFFFKVFHFSALTSESITHYIILVAGYLAFSNLFRSKFNRFIFAIVWFFPPVRQIDLLRFNLGVEYSLIAVAVYLLNRNLSFKPAILQHTWNAGVVMMLILSAWVSDLALITIVLLLFFQTYYYFKTAKPNRITFRNTIRTLGIWYLLTGIIAGTVFLWWAKSTGTKAPSYNAFAGFGTIMNSSGIFLKTIFDFLFFRVRDPLTGIYSWLAVILVLSLLVMRRKIKLNPVTKKWFLFFTLDAVLILLVLLLSQWVSLNAVARRYFVCVYISAWIAFILVLDNFEISRFKRFLQVIVFITVIAGGAGTIYTLKYIWPKTLKPNAEIVKEFRSLGNIGIIADYWSSYIISAVSPDQIVATAHDKATVRNREFVKEVFNRENIYVINGSWLKTYPDTLVQFGRVLIKDGDQFRLGNSNICRYRLKE